QSVIHDPAQKHAVDTLLDLVPHRPDHFPAETLEKRPAHRVVGPCDQAHLPELPHGRLCDHRLEKRPPDTLPPVSLQDHNLINPAPCRPGPQVAIAHDLAVPLGDGDEDPPGRGRIIEASCIGFPVEAVRVGKASLASLAMAGMSPASIARMRSAMTPCPLSSRWVRGLVLNSQKGQGGICRPCPVL